MSPRMLAIADTCFLIDWARYRRRDILFKIFETVFVPEDVLREVRSENTIAWIAGALARDNLSLYTPMRDEVEEARVLIEESRLNPRMPSIDMPEALCLVIGRRRRYIVLTENRGALAAPSMVPGYREVKVWRALEILLEAARQGVIQVDCEKPRRIFDEYSEDTLHLFPSKHLEQALREVERSCRTR